MAASVKVSTGRDRVPRSTSATFNVSLVSPTCGYGSAPSSAGTKPSGSQACAVAAASPTGSAISSNQPSFVRSPGARGAGENVRASSSRTQLAARRLEGRLVEDVAAETPVEHHHARGLDRLELPPEIRQHEGEQRRLRQLVLVQADREPAVGDDGIGIGPGLAGGHLGEAEPLVECERFQHLRRLHADLEEAADHAAAPAMRSATSPREAIRLRRVVVERGNVMEPLAAGREESRAAADRDLLERLQAIHGESRADHRERAHARARERAQPRFGVGLEPARAADPRLECDRPSRGREREPFGDESRRRLAAIAVRIAGIGIAPRDAVEGEQQVIAGRRRGDGGGERRDVIRFRVIILDQRQRRRLRPSRDRGLHAVGDRGRRRRGILRIERQHDQPADSRSAERVERRGDGRIAVGHADATAGAGETDACRRRSTACASARVCTSSGEPASVQISR